MDSKSPDDDDDDNFDNPANDPEMAIMIEREEELDIFNKEIAEEPDDDEDEANDLPESLVWPLRL